jgi:hypothetical protein
MSRPPEPVSRVRRITDQRAHLRVTLVGRTGAERTTVRFAHRNLWTLSRVDLQVRLGRAQSATRAERALAPEHPVLAIGPTALAIHRAADQSSTYDPTIASSATTRVLAVIPRLLTLHGDQAHVGARFRNIAPEWLTNDWGTRVLCAEPPTDDLTATHRHQQLGLDATDLERRSALAVHARELARRAAGFSREVDVLFETETAVQRVHVPVLAPPGVVLAAWAQWSEFLARFVPGDRPTQRDTMLHQVGAVLLQADHEAVASPHPARALSSAIAPEIARHAVTAFFESMLSNDHLLTQTARLAHLRADTAYARLIALRSELVGRHLTVVREDR